MILDEAQHLRHEVLDELRLLTNSGLDSERRLCLLPVGQYELRRRMAMAHHEALAQSVVVRYHLAGFRREEVEPYLAHSVRLAGWELPLFEPAAGQALFQTSHGLPRQVSSLAHYALSGQPLPTQASSSVHENAASPVSYFGVRRLQLMRVIPAWNKDGEFGGNCGPVHGIKPCRPTQLRLEESRYGLPLRCQTARLRGFDTTQMP